MKNAGNILNALRGNRNQADYDFDHALDRVSAVADVRRAKEIIRVLQAAGQEPIKSQITEAMKIYERDMLKQVTWQPK